MTSHTTPELKTSPQPSANSTKKPRTILGIVGSPRKGGNTDILVSRILEGAKDAGASVERIFLDDLVIRECTGCHSCWMGKRCSRKDDMNDIYPKIAEADAFVFGTPVYWYGPSALMKAFIDRFVYFNHPSHRPEIEGKQAVVAVPYEEDDPHMADGVMTFFDKSCHYLTVTIEGSILVPGVTLRGEVKNKEVSMQKAYDLGSRLGKIQG